MRRHTKSAAQWFSPTDRRRLERALSTVREARLYRRIEAVLLVAEGQPISDAAQRARATRLSVRRWVERYLAAHDATWPSPAFTDSVTRLKQPLGKPPSSA